MVSKTNSGFTMIETILVLGVSAALTIAIMIVSGTTIGQQRYKDSLNTLKSTIQEQFSITANPTSSRTGAEACAGATIVTSPVQPRGTSECLLLGRLMRIDADGKKYTLSDVIGERSATAPTELGASDIAELNNYKIASSPLETTVDQIAWDARVVKNTAPYAPVAVSILVIRSPLSGAIMTYTAEGAIANLNSMITNANASTPRTLCVEAAPSSFVGNRTGVKIAARASSQGAVEIPRESDKVCG